VNRYPKNYLTMPQNSPEWLTERIGRVTASRVKDVVSTLKSGKESAKRASYKLELLQEVLTGRAVDHYVTDAMQHGIETEPLARTAYEMAREVEVDPIGMIIHPQIARSSASPDGLLGKDGILELKCPTTPTHLSYLLEGVMPEDYIPQCMWQLACSGRQYCDFASFDPRLPEEFGLFIVRLQRDEKVIAAMEFEVVQFIAELNDMCAKLLKDRPLKVSGPGPERAVIPQSL
jgi:putative phage-type endonuclease